MKLYIKVFAIFSLVILITGCAGMLMDSFTHSLITSDKTFYEVGSNREAIPTENGRIFIYRTNDSTNSTLVYGIGIQKNLIICKLDEKEIRVYWEIYLYYNLAPGKHMLSCRNPDRKYETLNFIVEEKSSLYMRIDNIVETLKTNDKKYIDIDEDDTDEENINIKVLPVLVNEEIAKNELKDLYEYTAEK